MFVGIAINLTGRLLASTSPAALFANGEVGVWYDPSQINTLFQDSAGTTPVTAPNQPVGLMLDKSKNGIGANGASRRNLLTYTEQFDNAAWTKTRSTISANNTTSPDGTLTADKLVEDTTATSNHYVASLGQNIGAGGVFTIYAKAAERTKIGIRESSATGAYGTFNLATGSVINSGSATNVTATSVGSGWYRLQVAYSSSSSVNFAIFILTDAYTTGNPNLFTYTGDGTSGIYIWGAQLETGSTATAYQPITSSWTATIAGNHATQATSTQRPIYGINPITGTRNLLTYTEQFDNAVWLKGALVTITPNFDTAPDGTTTADRFVSSGGAFPQIVQTKTLTAGQPYTFSLWVKSDGTSQIAQALLLEGSVTSFTPTTTWTRISVSIASSAGGSQAVVIATNSAVSAASSFLIWGAQLEVGSTATAYQKVVSQYEVTQAGVQSASYIAFDGVDDGMVTPTITPATDKVQVFAGVRKLSDAADNGMIAEFGNAATSGYFFLTGPRAASTGSYRFFSTGTASTEAFVSTGYAAPITNVLTGIGDISAPVVTLRINGTQVATNSATQGTGNYLAYPLYIGRRGGTTFPFNGRLYSLIVRFGANLTTGQITATESWVNGETGAY